MKVFYWILGVVFVVLVVLFGALPTWISTPTGTQTLLKWVNPNIPGEISVDKVKLSWFGQQRLENFYLQDASGKKIASVQEFETDTPLIYLLFGGRHFNATTMVNPYLFLEEKAEGVTNIKEAVSQQVRKKPKTKKRRKLPSFDGGLSVVNGKVVLSAPKVSPITISEIFVDKLDKLKITAKTQQGSVEGSLFINAALPEKGTTHIDLKIEDFPVAILDQLGETSLFTEALGKTLNADIDLQKGVDHIFLDGKIESPNLNASIYGETREGRLHINPESKIVFTITPNFFEHAISPSQRAEWRLASNTDLTLHIEKGIIPLKMEKPDFANLVLQAQATIDRAELAHQELGGYSLNNFEATVTSANNLEIAYKGVIKGKETSDIEGTMSITPDGDILYQYNYQGFPVSLLEIFSPESARTLRSLFGHRFDVTSEGSVHNGEIDAHFTLKSPKTELAGTVKGKLPELRFEVNGNVTLVGEKAKIIGSLIEFELAGTGVLERESFVIPRLSGRIFNPRFEAEVKGKVGERGKSFSYDQIQFISTGIITDPPYEALKDGSFFVRVEGARNLILGKVASKGIEADFEMRDYIAENTLDFAESTLTFKCNAKDLPLALVQPFVPEEINLSELLGPTIDLKTKGAFTAEEKRLDLEAGGYGFSASISVTFDETLNVQQNKPAEIHWELTQERYDSLIHGLFPNLESNPTFTLVGTTPIDLTVSQFTCPRTPPKEISNYLCHSGFSGYLKTGPMTFRNLQTNESFVIHEISGSIDGSNFADAIDLTLRGDLYAANVPHAEKSAFSFNGKLFNFWTEEGKFNRDGLTLSGELNIDHFPVRQLTGLLPIDEEMRTKAQAVLGELMNARIYGEISQMSGPLTIDLKASNFKALLPLQLTPNAIYLRDYVDAEITITPEVNASFLVDINPLFITGAYSDHPLKLYIDPEGFVLPINPFSFKEMQINKAIIDIGKINVRNGGDIQKLMDFLKAKDVTHDGVMEAWFTPIFMSLKDGTAKYKRFDALLAGNVHIALWGQIDLIKDKVKMTLGIAPTTLYQKFGVLGLSKKDMFQVKMRGSTKNLDMDWSSAYTRIGIIIARTAGGPYGYIVGGIVEQFVTAFGEEPPPPPTTDPLPWESQYPSEPGEKIPEEAPPKKAKGKLKKKLKELLIP